MTDEQIAALRKASAVLCGTGYHAEASTINSLLYASIADTAGAVERMETTSEHIARDIREGRFPKRSEPQMVGIADTAGAKPEPVRDVVEAWDAYTADRSNEQAAILFVLAMNKLREELATPPAPSSDTAGAKPVAWLIDPGAGSAMDKLQRDEPGALQMMDIKRRGGSVTPLYAAPPAPSVADAAGASEQPTRKKLCIGSHIMCEGREYCLGHPSCSDLAKESGND